MLFIISIDYTFRVVVKIIMMEDKKEPGEEEIGHAEVELEKSNIHYSQPI